MKCIGIMTPHRRFRTKDADEMHSYMNTDTVRMPERVRRNINVNEEEK